MNDRVLLGKSECLHRHEIRYLDNVKRLNKVIDKIRKKHELYWQMPYFDPKGGGENANILFLGVSPGTMSILTGFVSVDNPDPTDVLLNVLMTASYIDFEKIALWNIIPYYLCDEEGKLCKPTMAEIKNGLEILIHDIFPLFPQLKAICLVGKHLRMVESCIDNIFKGKMLIYRCPDPNPRSMTMKSYHFQEAMDCLTAISLLM